MGYLEAKDDDIKNLENLATTNLNLLQTYRFWKLIFDATGRVENLHSHSYVVKIRKFILDFVEMIIKQEITIRSLQGILEYDDETLYNFFNF